MLDLSPKAVKNFWRQRGDITIMQIIEQMETADTWTLDEQPEFEEKVSDFANWLSDKKEFDLTNEKDFIELMVSLKTGRALRLLQYIDQLQPGSASKLLIYAEVAAETDNAAKCFLQRNLIFERMQLLSRIFAPNRFSLLMKSIEKVESV